MIRTDEQARKEWRTFGYWVLAHSLWAWPSGILSLAALAITLKNDDIAGMVMQLGVIAGMWVAGFLAAAGIRQWGKNDARRNGQEE